MLPLLAILVINCLCVFNTEFMWNGAVQFVRAPKKSVENAEMVIFSLLFLLLSPPAWNVDQSTSMATGLLANTCSKRPSSHLTENTPSTNGNEYSRMKSFQWNCSQRRPAHTEKKTAQYENFFFTSSFSSSTWMFFFSTSLCGVCFPIQRVAWLVRRLWARQEQNT